MTVFQPCQEGGLGAWERKKKTASVVSERMEWRITWSIMCPGMHERDKGAHLGDMKGMGPNEWEGSQIPQCQGARCEHTGYPNLEAPSTVQAQLKGCEPAKPAIKSQSRARVFKGLSQANGLALLYGKPWAYSSGHGFWCTSNWKSTTKRQHSELYQQNIYLVKCKVSKCGWNRWCGGGNRWEILNLREQAHVHYLIIINKQYHDYCEDKQNTYLMVIPFLPPPPLILVALTTGSSDQHRYGKRAWHSLGVAQFCILIGWAFMRRIFDILVSVDSFPFISISKALYLCIEGRSG